MRNISGLKKIPPKYNKDLMLQIIRWRNQITNAEGILTPRDCIIRIMKTSEVSERTAKIWVKKAERIYGEMLKGISYEEAHARVCSLMYKLGETA